MAQRKVASPVYLQSAGRAIDGRSVLSGARAPLDSDGRVGDFWIDTTGPATIYGPRTAAGWPAGIPLTGYSGWSPLFAVAADGDRRVLKVVDWTGGEGAKPASGLFVGTSGLVEAIGDAADVRGPIGDVTPAALAAAAAAAESAAGGHYDLLVFSYGQSLAMRYTPKVTSSFSSKLLMFNGGVEVSDAPTYSNFGRIQQIINYESLVSFANPVDKEGWGPGLGYQLGLSALCDRILFNTPAKGAYEWRILRPGTAEWGQFAQCLMQGITLLRAAGSERIIPVLIWTHIEADADELQPASASYEDAVTAEQAKLIQEDVRDSWRYDLSTRFGELRTDPIFVTPLNSATYVGSRPAQAGQLAASLESGGIYLLSPHYQFYLSMATDGIHLGGQGRRYMAELSADIIRRVLFTGEAWRPVQMVSATRSSTTVTVTFHAPGGSIALDTTTFAGPTNWSNSLYGFEFYDDGVAIDVTAVSVTGDLTVELTLDSAPSGAEEVRIAQQPWPGVGAYATTYTPRSNIRDATLSVTAEDSTVLYHYAIPQTIAVT